MLQIVREPWIEDRDSVAVLEIPIVTPMKGLFQVSDKLWKELSKYVLTHQIEEAGPYYLRFRVIDMSGDMAISVGVPVFGDSPKNERVMRTRLPRGRYACMRYIGHGLVANKKLLAWIGEQRLTIDRWEEPQGDAFRNRRETFLTDRRQQPLKKQWTIELSFKLTD